MVEIARADVLVIGGGAAGTNAALKAADAGARVLMIVKGPLGKSGCSIFASHLPYHDVSTNEKASDRFRYSVRYYNHYLTDQHHVRRMGKYMREEFFDDFERAGIYWRRTADGRLMASGGKVPVAVAHKQGASGVILMDKRRRQILARGIPVWELTAATALLTENGRVVGATALDVRRGVLKAVLAPATVLATGHSDYLATRATGTREMSADGIALALRAGAGVANLEIQWWHASDVLEPRGWMRAHIYPNPLLGTEETSRLYNSEGQIFYEQRTHGPGSSAPYVDQLRRLAREVAAGRARWDGGYWSGYDHIPAEAILAYQHQAKIWKKLGLDVGRDRLECGITFHMRQGGVDVDPETMRTSIEGLHVAGGLGAHYLGGVGPCSFDGKIAGEAAAASTAHPAPSESITSAIAAEERRVLGLLAPGDGIRPVEIKLAIRDVMWRLGYVKNEAKLSGALAELMAIRAHDVPRMRLERAGRTWNTGWTDALDALSMLDACEATVRSGLLRKESRGPFYREDYPYVDNENWLRKIVLSRTDGEWRARTVPYSLPFLQPEAGREPFFDVDY